MKRNRSILYLVCMCGAMFFSSLTFSFLPPLVTRMVDNIGTTLTIFSGLLSLRSLANMLASFFLCGLLDRIPATRVVSIALFLLIPIALIFPLTHSQFLMVISFILMGISCPLVESGSDAVLFQMPDDQADRVGYLLYGSTSVGGLIAPVLLRNAMENGSDFLWAPFLYTAPVIILCILIWILPDPGVGAAKKNKPQESAPAKGFYPLIVWIAAVFIFFNTGGEGALLSFISTAVYRDGLATEADAALITTFYWVGSLFARFIAICLSRKLNPGQMLFGGSILIVAASFAFLFSDNLLLCYIFSALYGFAAGPVFSSFLSCVNHSYPLNGQVIGFLLGANALGCMLIPWAGGKILDDHGTTSFLLLVAAVAILSLILQIPLAKSGAKKTMEAE